MKKNYKKISISFVTLMSLVGLTTISGLALTAARASADDVVDNVAITVPVSCTMSGTGINTHTKEVVNGTYEANIGTTTMKVLCNDNSGFSIYATGFTNETIAETNSNKLVGTNASGNATIDTGLAQSGNTSNWAMKLATNSQATYPITITSDTEGPFSSYHTVPSTWTKVATRTAGTDIGAVAEGSTITSTYAAYINSTQPADTYTGKVKYTLVHPNDAPAPTPPSPFETCNTPVPNITYMQDITSSNKSTVLASLTEEAPYFLRDSRNEEPYCVSKLKDGNLWLLDNLRLDLSDADILADITETNTNASATSLGYLKNGGGTTSDQHAITGVVEWTDSPTYASGYSYSDPLIVTSGSGWSKDTTTTSYGNGSGKIGVYYNYCAASAGSYCYGNGTSYGTPTGDATEDLCPAGWRMPSKVAGEYGTLYNIYNTTRIATDTASLQYNLSTPLSGYFYKDGSALNQGTAGYFWSSTREYDYSMYSFNVSSSNVYPSSGNYRYNGQSIRCILK